MIAGELAGPDHAPARACLGSRCLNYLGLRSVSGSLLSNYNGEEACIRAGFFCLPGRASCGRVGMMIDSLTISERLKKADLKPKAADEIAKIFQQLREEDDQRLVTRAALRTELAELKIFILKVVGAASTAIVAVLAAIKYFG